MFLFSNISLLGPVPYLFAVLGTYKKKSGIRISVKSVYFMPFDLDP
jgi:hypothetical protein